jgi:hypothetical protein
MQWAGKKHLAFLSNTYHGYLSRKVDGTVPFDPYFSSVAEVPTLSISCTDGWYFHNNNSYNFSLYQHVQVHKQ